MENFHYAISLALTLYQIEGDLEDLEEIGLVGYNMIGNKNTYLVHEILPVNCKDGSIQLPCDVFRIEAVTYCGPEDWNYTSNQHGQGGDTNSLFVENYIESTKAFNSPFYVSGKFVKYKRVGDKLYVNKGLGRVHILYHKLILDEDDLPYLNNKEALAVAEFIAYTKTYLKAILTNNLALLKMATDLHQRWLFHCDAARVPEHISQEEMDAILDVQSSFNRKTHNKSYKPIM